MLHGFCSVHTDANLGVLGFHLKVPLITHYEPIRVTLQTKEVNSIFSSYGDDVNCHIYI